MEDEAWIEEAIARELNAIGDLDDNNNEDGETADVSLLDLPDSQADTLEQVEGQEDSLIPSMQEYITAIQKQSAAMEQELDEVDQLLQQADIVSARRAPDEDLARMAEEQGLTAEQLRQQVVRQLEEEERQEEAEVMTEVAMDTVTDLLSAAQVSARDTASAENAVPDAFLTSLLAPVPNQEATTSEPKHTESTEQSIESVDMSKALMPVSNAGCGDSQPDGPIITAEETQNSDGGVVAVVYEHELLEKQSLQEVRELDQRYKHMDDQRSKERRELQQAEEQRWRTVDEKRQQQLHVIRQEEQAVHKLQQEKELTLKKEEVQRRKQVEQTLDEYETEINELARQMEQEKAEFEASLKEESKKQDEKRNKAAITIQANYKGYRVRKEHGEEVEALIEDMKERAYEVKVANAQRKIDFREKQQKREKAAEQRSKEIEGIKQRQEDERQRKLDEERQKKEEEERLKEEVKMRKEEEERLKKEEEKRRKEEEKKRKEDEKRRKEEEERQRKEEQKRQKEEEKRKKEEEKKRKEEEKRLKKEEEERKKKEEKEQKEREEKERIERVKREKEEKESLEREKKEREYRERKEKEEKDKTEREAQERKQREEKERKCKEEEERLQNEKRLKEETEKKKKDMDVIGEKLSVDKRGMTEFFIDEVARMNSTEPPDTPPTPHKPPSHNSPSSKTPRPPSARKPSSTYERPISGKRRTSTPNQSVDTNHVTNGDGNYGEADKVAIVMADNTRERMQGQNELAASRSWGQYLPQTIEDARLHWIEKQCKSLSKIVSENKTLRAGGSKKPPRRPPSAKLLPPLQEHAVLAAARVHSLKMVTTVELSDLPGCSLATLSQCAHLKSLRMPNCQLVTTEGLEHCKHLQTLHLQNNKLELLSVKELTNLLYADLSNNALASIHGLEGCTALRHLDLSHNNITRIGALGTLKQLHTLNLSHNQLITSRGLAEAPSVQCLDLSHNHLQGVDDLENLALLQRLSAAGNNLMQVPKLTNQVLLHTLTLSDNSVSFLSSLTQTWLPLLATLNLSHNSISVLDPMLNFLLLEHLDLSHNQLIDAEQLVSPLRATRYLLTLDLSANPVCEDPSYSAKLKEVLPFLEKLNNSSLPNSAASLQRTEFEQMCLAQSLQVQQLDRAYQAALQRVQDPLACARLHQKYFTTSQTLASDMRYSHEYGITMITPKPIDMNFDLKPVQNEVPNNGSQATPVPSHNSKNKFEDALKGNSAKVNPPQNGSHSSLTTSSSSAKNAFADALAKQNRGLDIARQSPAPLDAKASFERNLMKSMTNTNSKATVATTQSQDMKSRFDAAVNKGPAVNGNSHSVTPQASQTTNVKTSTVMQMLSSSGGDFARLLDYSATKIQACWRGYILRKRLNVALSYAKFDDLDDDLENFDEEVDLGDFDFNMDDLDKDLMVPDTPQIPANHAVLGKPPSHPAHKPPAVPPLHDPASQAWRATSSALSDPSPRVLGNASGMGRHPLPPLSDVSDAHTIDTQRTGRSRKEKEDKLAEEWGFKDNKTAELMMQRARKLKYNALKKKKLSKLDPRQRLELYRRLEEASHVKVPAASKHSMPRKEYFQAREEEARKAELEQRSNQHERVHTNQEQASRTFEWVHTQVNPQYEVTSSRIHPSKTGSEGNLPRIDPAIINGGRAMLAGSPAPLDVQSIESASTLGEPAARPQRLWRTNSNKEERLPPIKPNSAPKERMSFRNPKTDMDVGWGGGRKRNIVRQ